MARRLPEPGEDCPVNMGGHHCDCTCPGEHIYWPPELQLTMAARRADEKGETL